MNKGQRAGESSIAVDLEQGKSYFWCSCGKSSKQPFCDGSHKGTGFKPLVYKAEFTKKCFFVHANKQMISLSVMAHIIKSDIANQNITTILN